jgi:hypothetical protein
MLWIVLKMFSIVTSPVLGTFVAEWQGEPLWSFVEPSPLSKERTTGMPRDINAGIRTLLRAAH